MPFLLIGFNSLRLNGVSAISDSFLQILMTTSSSKTLQKAAIGGCLGGEQNIPRDLKELEVRFGELVKSDERKSIIRRAGLGTEDEVVPLRRGVAYGQEIDH